MHITTIHKGNLNKLECYFSISFVATTAEFKLLLTKNNLKKIILAHICLIP